MHRTLSRTSAAAVGAMLELAVASRAGPVALKAIGERQGISKSYLDQLFSKLRSHALVRATRGPGGGYSLGREASQISVADIVLAVEEPRSPRGRKNTAATRLPVGQYQTRDLWSALNDMLVEWLAAISLKALVDERLAGEEPAAGARLARGIALRPAPKHVHVQVPNSVFALGSTPMARSQWAR